MLAGCGTQTESAPTTGEAAGATDRGHGEQRQKAPRSSADEPTRRSFSSAEAAVRFAQRSVEVPVSVPAQLQDAEKITVRAGPGRSAQLDVFAADGSLVALRFGEAVVFDGCDTPGLEQVQVAGAPALLVIHQTPEGMPLAELIWPADRRHRVGRFGLSGELSRVRALELAGGMDTAGVETPGKGRPEC
jgi:hypothetical protein